MIDKLSDQITYAVLTTDFVAIHGDERLLQNSVVFSDGIDPSVLAQRCAILQYTQWRGCRTAREDMRRRELFALLGRSQSE